MSKGINRERYSDEINSLLNIDYQSEDYIDFTALTDDELMVLYHRLIDPQEVMEIIARLAQRAVPAEAKMFAKEARSKMSIAKDGLSKGRALFSFAGKVIGAMKENMDKRRQDREEEQREKDRFEARRERLGSRYRRSPSRYEDDDEEDDRPRRRRSSREDEDEEPRRERVRDAAKAPVQYSPPEDDLILGKSPDCERVDNLGDQDAS